MSRIKGWIGVDLDGTLAHYDTWRGVEHIGMPIPEMVRRVKEWLADGTDVRVFTARVGPMSDEGSTVEQARDAVEKWCKKHIGVVLPVTATKDYGMIELWDDRTVQVVPNTGIAIRDYVIE